MSFIDEPCESSPIQALKPTPASVPVAKRNQLPPDVLIRIFQKLPIPSLVNVAVACRRFKVLAYDDEIWESKLRLIVKNDSSQAQASVLDAENTSTSLMDINQSIVINNKPLNELIPGLSTDPYNTRARAKSTGQAREKFKQLYIRLIPYYVDLRQKHRESRVLADFGAQPEECGKMLNMLAGLGACHVVDDWKQINETIATLCQYFESASLHEFELAYDVHNLPDMKKYAGALIALNGGSVCIQTFIQKHPIFYDNPFKPEDNYTTSPNDLEPFQNFMSVVCDEFRQQSSVIHDTFPPSADIFYTFVDRVLDDVVAEYVGSLLGIAQQRDTALYLHTMSVVLEAMQKLVAVVTSDDLPQKIDKERSINLIYKLFLPFMDDYLFEEENFVKKTCQTYMEEWKANASNRRDDATVRLTNQSRETFKRDYLMAFKKVILLPVDLVSSAAMTIASPFQKPKTSDESRPSTESTADSTLQGTPPSTPKVSTSVQSAASPKTPTDTRSMHSRQSSRHSLKSTDVRTPDLKSALYELDSLQDILSLEIVLQLIHNNKGAERRLMRFIDARFPGRMRTDIQKTYEHVFVHLLKALGPQHIQPAFDMAAKRLESYTPDPDAQGNTSIEVPPLTELFEMVHVGDVIQQMVQLYYDEEIVKYIDRHDFMNECNKEKKVFERILDDCVANGMDRAIQVLLDQVRCILTNEQRPEDYNPQEDIIMDLEPTKACRDAIECVQLNTSMLQGAAEKSTMDLFFSEIGRRFSEVLFKHLKSQTVNEAGGFRYICDANAYYDFAVSLRQKSVTPYFAALKSLANIYIISSAPDIKNVIHDLERYHGILNTEDLLEFAACRSDWPTIRKVVQKDMMDCSIM